MAVELEDWLLLGCISDGDLVAIEAKYHFDCLTSSCNRYRSLPTQRRKDSDEIETSEMIESRVFVELREHIKNVLKMEVIFSNSRSSIAYI